MVAVICVVQYSMKNPFNKKGAERNYRQPHYYRVRRAYKIITNLPI